MEHPSYEFHFTTQLDAPIERVWAVWSDMTKYPEWDKRELELRLDGPFAAGTVGYSKQKGNPGGSFHVVAVNEPTGWSNLSDLPNDELLIRHTLKDLGDHRTEITKSYTVTGPLEAPFRIWFAPTMRSAQK